jgi:hypothetical protein
MMLFDILSDLFGVLLSLLLALDAQLELSDTQFHSLLLELAVLFVDLKFCNIFSSIVLVSNDKSAELVGGINLF